MIPALPSQLVPEDKILFRFAHADQVSDFELAASWVAEMILKLAEGEDHAVQMARLGREGVPVQFALPLVALRQSMASTFPNGVKGGFVFFVATRDGQSSVSFHPYSRRYQTWDQYWLAMAVQGGQAAGILG